MTDTTAPAAAPATCDRHGGPWGSDETCPRCTTDDGATRTTPGAAGPGAVPSVSHTAGELSAVARRRYRLEYAAASDDVTRLERLELAAWRALSGHTGRTLERAAAVVIVLCTLALSVTAAPDADAATTDDTRTGARAWAVSLPLSPWLPACEHEDSSDCVGGGGDWTATRGAAGVVCIAFRPGHDEADYCTADAYPPAGAPVWEQLTPADARAVVARVGGDVDAWAACAVTMTGPPELACPGGGTPLPADDARTA